MVFIVAPNCRKKIYGVLADEYTALQPNIYAALLDRIFNDTETSDMIDLEALNLSNSDGAEVVLSSGPDEIVVVSCGHNPSSSTMKMPGVIDFCKEVRKRSNTPISLWGGHPTSLPERSLKETGATRVISGLGFDKEDFRSFPGFDWDKIDPRDYKAHNWHCFGDLQRTPYAVILTSLGCPYQCDFCCTNCIPGGYIERDMDEVLGEVDILANKGVRNIKISDDLFVLNPRRVEKFCNHIIERGYNLNMWCFSRTDTVGPRILELLKKAGVNWIAYGFESVSQKIIDSSLKKNRVASYENVIKMTRDSGINIIADIVAGFWEDTYATLEETYQWACNNNFEYMNLYPLFAYPGTDLYNKMLSDGKIQEPKSWDEYALFGYDAVPCPTKELEPSEVLAWRDYKICDYFKRFDYLKMIQDKFGENTRIHVEKMAQYTIPRRIIDERTGPCAIR